MNANALNTQIGGAHYVNLPLQPVEFAQRNGWDFCAASAIKYIVRHRSKAGLVDLNKAVHFGELRLQLMPASNWKLIEAIRSIYSGKKQPSEFGVSMERFISLNGLQNSDEAVALIELDRWVRGIDSAGTGYFAAMAKLISRAYPNGGNANTGSS